MPRETEIKARLADPAAFRDRLEAEGARCIRERELEDNWLLDDQDRRVFGSGHNLRVRSAGGRVVLTWKGPRTQKGALRSREELEVDCDDAAMLLEIFARLGYSPTFRYQKYRETWALGSTLVTIDHTPAGDFAEIEGEEPELQRVVARLGLEEESLVPESYPALLLRWLAERGSAEREAVFGAEPNG